MDHNGNEKDRKNYIYKIYKFGNLARKRNTNQTWGKVQVSPVVSLVTSE